MQTIILIVLLTITSSTVAQTYGPTKAGDLLWNIAGKVRPNKSITRYQAMLALLKANPQAFQISCNLNTLKIGKILTIPLNMQELTSKEAVNEFYRQHDEWQDFRRKNKQIICHSTMEKSIVEVPSIKISNIDTKITSTETFETIIPEEVTPKQSAITILSPQTIQILTNNESKKSEYLTLIQNIWDDIQTWFYSISYLYQILFSVLIIFFSIFLLLSLFSLISRNKIDKPDSVNVEEILPTENNSIPEQSNKMKENLDTVRAYLAEDEAQRIKKLLREVIQNGTEEQRTEAQQLYEIDKKMSYLKLTDTQSINTNLTSIEKINKLIPAQLPLVKNKEQVFSLVDEVFMILDEELNAQGELIDSYIARQQEIVNSNIAASYASNYQVVEEEQLRHPELKSTRRL